MQASLVLGSRQGEVFRTEWLEAADEEDLEHGFAKRAGGDGENIHIRNDGHDFYAESTVSLRRNDNGDVVGHLQVIRDVTIRKKAEELLRRNHETFFKLVRDAPLGIYIVDADFRLVQVSAGSRKVFSHVNPLIGRDFEEVMRIVWAEPFATEAIGLFRHTLETGEPYRGPKRQRSAAISTTKNPTTGRSSALLCRTEGMASYAIFTT